MSDVTVLGLEAMEHAFGGIFTRARASLGVTAFGMNVIDLPPMSGDFYPEHDHAADGQEEVYFLLAGEADLVLPDRVVELVPLATMARVGPAVRRRVRSGPQGCRLLVVGGVPGGAYVPQANATLGGPETFAPGASSAALPGGPPPALARRGRF